MRWVERLYQWWYAAPVNPVQSLHVSGVAMAVLYLAAAVASSFPKEGLLKPLAEPARWLLVGGLGFWFLVGLRAVQHLEASRATRLVLGYSTLLLLLASLVTPFQSTDIYVYINRGWMQYQYQANPYSVMIYEIPGFHLDPMFYNQWLFNPTPYGFLFSLENWLCCVMAGNNHALNVILQKLIAVVSFVLLGWLVRLGSHFLNDPLPHRTLYAYFCCPILLLHHVSHAHNDLQMMLGLGLALVAALSGRWWMVFPALMLGILIKMPVVVAGPLLALYCLKKFGWWRTGTSIVLACVLFAVSGIPYYQADLGRKSDTLASDLADMYNSPAAMLVYPLELTQKFSPTIRELQPLARKVAQGVCALAFAAVYGVLLWKRLRNDADSVTLLHDVTIIMFALTLLSPKYHGWYVGLFLPFTLIMPPSGRLHRAGLAVGLMNLLNFTALQQAHFANALVMMVLPFVWAYRHTEPTPISTIDEVDDVPELGVPQRKREAA